LRLSGTKLNYESIHCFTQSLSIAMNWLRRTVDDRN
jgi:hypothetical protein